MRAFFCPVQNSHDDCLPERGEFAVVTKAKFKQENIHGNPGITGITDTDGTCRLHVTQ